MRLLNALLVILTALVLTGCDRGSRDPRLVLAEKCREAGDFTAAERQFRQYLQSHPQAARVHLRLASLYDESLEDPLAAVCHYREYLHLVPHAPDAENVKVWMQSALSRCMPSAALEVKKAPVTSADPAPELQRLTRENAVLKRLVMKQQQELARLRKPAGRPAAPAAPAAPKTEEMTEYTVQSGDHLGKIARRFYGSSRKIGPILSANDLKPGSMLHVGQKLKIPKTAR